MKKMHFTIVFFKENMILFLILLEVVSAKSCGRYHGGVFMEALIGVDQGCNAIPPPKKNNVMRAHKFG